MTRVYVTSFLAQVAQEARKEKQYTAAVTAMVQAAKVAGAYVETTEQRIKFPQSMEELSEAEVEHWMHFFEKLAWGNDTAAIEAARRKAGLIEASATVIKPHAESS